MKRSSANLDFDPTFSLEREKEFCGNLLLFRSDSSSLDLISGEEIARYLNEFDDNSVGDWETVTDLDLAQQTGQNDRTSNSACQHACGGGCCESKAARKIAKNGRAIFMGRNCSRATSELPNVFRVLLLDSDCPQNADFHIAIQVEKFEQQCLIPTICGSYFEWAECQCRTKKGTQL